MVAQELSLSDGVLRPCVEPRQGVTHWLQVVGSPFAECVRHSRPPGGEYAGRKQYCNLGAQFDTGQLSRGVRAVAAKIGISAATLSRVEQGHLPDLGTFSKLCRWLNLDPAEVFGLDVERPPVTSAASLATAHLRADRTLDPRLAQALGEMIVRAQVMLADEPAER